MDFFGGAVGGDTMLNPWASLITDSLDDVIEQNESRWVMLRMLCDSVGEATVAEQSAALFPAEARLEAAKKLITNHIAVLKDVTNPSPSTQLELARVPRAEGKFVDLFLLEARPLRPLFSPPGYPSQMASDSQNRWLAACSVIAKASPRLRPRPIFWSRGSTSQTKSSARSTRHRRGTSRSAFSRRPR